MHNRLFVTLFLGSALAVFAACGDDDNTPVDLDAGTGTDAAQQDAAPGQATQTGRIIEALQNTALPGATVTIAGQSATTGDDGTYSLTVPTNTPYTMVVTADAHYKLLEQEWSVAADLDRGDTSLLATTTANLLASLLPNRDPAKGLLVVKVAPLPPCTTEEGSTLTLDPPGDSKLIYFESGRPSSARTSVKAGESFSAAFYNIEPGAKVAVKVTSPACEQKAFPVTVQGVTYTGNTTIEGGEALTFERVFLETPLDTTSDAGVDSGDAGDAGDAG